ncbi:DUF4157 domain-containing protein [Microcoleus sp. D3_18a_C4]|uniref:DUF4157 domain-containing protein n=1 Tax=Microcoleus sp. D3_18a_C4 TaxID=3055332 RepID=UPI002FCE8DD7
MQAKLTVNQPGDKYEQEADEVAEQVVKQINAPASDRLVKAEAIQTEKLMRKSVSSPGAVAGGMAATPDLETSIKQKQGNGQPISQDIREPIEQSLNHDFSGVRVHTDDQSDKLNHSLQSVAFTRGQDIFFKRGTYQPRNREGQKLLIHELTHVVQQGSQRQIIQRVTKTKKRDIFQEVLKETGPGGKAVKAAFGDLEINVNTSTGISSADIASNIGKGMEEFRNKEKNTTTDQLLALGKGYTGALSSATSITSKRMTPDSIDAGVVDVVSEVSGGVSSLFGVLQEAKGLLEKITSDKSISKTEIWKAAYSTLTNMGKTAKAGAAAAGKIQKLKDAKDAQAQVSSNTSSVIGESVTLFESMAKGIEQFATFVKDYQEGKFDKGDLKSHRIVELVFQSVTTLQTITSGALGLGKAIAKVVGNDAAKVALGVGTSAMEIVTGSIQILQSTYKIGRAAAKKEKLDILAEGRSEEEQKALMLIKDRLTKQQANAGINMVLGAAGIVSGSLAVSGVGALPGAIIAGIAAGFKISRVGFKKFKQYMRDKAQTEYDEAVTILTEVAEEVKSKTTNPNEDETGTADFLPLMTAEYQKAIKERIGNIKDKKTKKVLESVLEDVKNDELPLLNDLQISMFMARREYKWTIDILKQTAKYNSKTQKLFIDDLLSKISEGKTKHGGHTKKHLLFIKENYVDKGKPIPSEESEMIRLVQITEEAELARIDSKNPLLRSFTGINNRLKSTKQKEAKYALTAETILSMKLDEVYTILNLNPAEIKKAAEKAKKEAEEKYSTEEYNDLAEEDKESSIQGEVAEAVKKLVIKKLKDIN